MPSFQSLAKSLGFTVPHGPSSHQAETVTKHLAHAILHQELYFSPSLVVLQREVQLSRKKEQSYI